MKLPIPLRNAPTALIDQKVFLESLGSALTDYLIVSQVDFGKALGDVVHACEEVTGLSVAVLKAHGTKCERCWKFSTSVGENATHPTLCQRCIRVIS